MFLQGETVPAERQAYLATSCGPCLSCLRRQHPATHGRPLVFGHGPPSHVCPLEKESSDLDCPSLPFQVAGVVGSAFCVPSAHP